ncbi:Vacuolar fusion CCZ1 protein [Rutstroemia sp. NJR-2017a BBW]|nr:Vacuolar fusion CCZ1 protein [Rutstroemia sp. NJR-2017a BBW]
MSEQRQKVVPARLGFLAIYNPSLGTTDEEVENQIVYYYPLPKQNGQKKRGSLETEEERAIAKEQKNEQLRQIGLAQGMVEFGRSFADGKSVDTVETEKSRIILHELESGWWILAKQSVSLTILPSTSKPPASKDKAADERDAVEYSSREVKPAISLLGDLLRAHSNFLLHHSSSLSALFVRTKRSKFISILGKFWDTYISTWNVLMHGNPANDLYGGIKIAACGELGVGVGEEDRGSGEREVLEGMIERTDGLVDMIVSKFGDCRPNPNDETNKSFAEQKSKQSEPWLGSGNELSAEDGAIFLGTGAVSRKSLRDLSHWMEDIYRWGPYAYGVIDNPSSSRKAKEGKGRPKARQNPSMEQNDQASVDSKTHGRRSSILSNEVSTTDQDVSDRPSSMSANEANRHSEGGSQSQRKSRFSPRRPTFQRNNPSHTSTESEGSKSKKFTNYFKFGYGTHWSLGGSTTKDEGHGMPKITESGGSTQNVAAINASPDANKKGQFIPEFDDSTPHYLVGLMGNLNLDDEKDAHSDAESGDEGYNSRLVLRTLTVELEREEDARQENEISIDYSGGNRSSSKLDGSEHTGTSNTSFESQDRNKTKKLRVVVYVNRPFIFVLLFELQAGSLAFPGLYSSLHKQFLPLHKPLLNSTSFRAAKPSISPTDNNTTSPVYDLLYDPVTLTLHSTIPPIPDPHQFAYPDELPWSRIEALNTHMQILNTYIATTTDRNTLERTCKTSRGYWILWTRIPSPPSPPSDHESTPQASPSVRPPKIPHLIPEDSAESQTSHSFLRPGVDPLQAKSRTKDSKAGTRKSSTMKSSTRSGPAHPFLDSTGIEDNDDSWARDKEIFLVRRASDWVGARGVVGRLSGGVAGGGGGEGWSAAGLGMDTKRYIEGLLSLNR